MAQFEQIFVVVIVIGGLIALYRELLKPAAIFFIMVVLFTVVGLISPKEALSGFSNVQVAVIMLLLLIGGIIKKLSLIDLAFDRFFKDNTSVNTFLAKLMAFVSVSSAFLNNTPIVATLIPYVYSWGRRNNVSASRLLIPLSYAAILGGTATLIGTSTNLLVNGLAIDNGLEGFSIFDFSIVGIPLIIVGFFYMLIFGKKLLPERKDALEKFSEKSREYVVETQVKPGSPLIGQNLEEAGLRDLRGLFLVEIVRGNNLIAPVGPDETVQENDVLIFAGELDTITDLVKSNLGLQLPQVGKVIRDEVTEIIESVVPVNSNLVGKTVKQSNFRGRYNAAIIAIHRNGERISGKIGEIELKAGDLLLMVCGRDFSRLAEDNPSIYVINKVKELHNLHKGKIALVGFGVLGAIILAAFNIFPLFNSLIVLLAIMGILKIYTLNDLKKNLDLDLLLIAAFAIAMGKAIINSGTAAQMADIMIFVFNPFGAIGIIFGIYLITNILTEFITNAAAATIIFPIALIAAEKAGIDPMACALVVAIAASASFITPIGYQTNLMVLGPGGYKFKDFTKVGFPLSLLYLVVTCVIVSWVYGLI